MIDDQVAIHFCTTFDACVPHCNPSKIRCDKKPFYELTLKNKVNERQVDGASGDAVMVALLESEIERRGLVIRDAPLDDGYARGVTA